MSKELSLIIAILVLASLLIIFIVSFILYKRTPVPKGCENLLINQENCAACNNKDCALYSKKEEK